MKELAQFLLDRAMEHDSPALLFNLAAGYLISAKVIRPGRGDADGDGRGGSRRGG
jgi:hypothetical protein